MTLYKINKLVVDPGAKSSRFVVNLKKDLVEDIILKDVRRPEDVGRLKANYGKILKRGTEKGGVYLAKIVKALKPEIAIIPPVARNDSKLNQLAFVGLGKFLFKLFSVICFSVGWLIMFALRLVYFILIALTKPFKKIFYLIFVKSHIVVHKISSDMPAGYRATQAVAATISAKLLVSLKRETRDSEGSAFAGAPRDNGQAFGLLKPVLIFAGVLLVIVLPVKAYTYYKSLDDIKGKVLGVSEAAISDLISGGKSAANLNFSQANQNFTQASDNFLNAQNQLNEINGLIFSLASLMPDKNMQLAAASPHILRAGELSAGAGKNLSLIMESFFSGGQISANLTDLISNASLYGHNAITNLAQLEGELNQISADILPVEYQKSFVSLKLKTGELKRGLEQFISLADGLSNFLGGGEDKRYLLVFQNNSELRASGGFIGSYAIVDFSKGQIKNIEVPGGGSYDTDAGFLSKIKAPEPLSLLRADWHFWDANWWPDWPTSARKLAWFYENSDGSTVDGVIGFTPTVMEKLLKIIGPIDLTEKYGLIITADNFWLETQKLSEQKPNVTKEPKKIIGDLMNKIIEELPKRLSQNNLTALFKITEESFSDKNILLYFADDQLESRIADLGADGKIKDTPGDYLNVINTNIGGQKSDREITQKISHQAQVSADGTIIDNLTITRTHQGIKNMPFTGVRNVDWLRVYVPAGSELIEAGGFAPVDKIFFDQAEDSWQNDPDVALAQAGEQTEPQSGVKIYNELGKTVFANWSQVDPGQTVEIKLKYKLPFKLTDKKRTDSLKLTDQLINQAGAILNPGEKNLFSYSLFVQKQPGMNSSTITSELKLSGNLKTLWQYPDDLKINQTGWSITENLDQDKLMASIIEE